MGSAGKDGISEGGGADKWSLRREDFDGWFVPEDPYQMLILGAGIAFEKYCQEKAEKNRGTRALKEQETREIIEWRRREYREGEQGGAQGDRDRERKKRLRREREAEERAKVDRKRRKRQRRAQEDRKKGDEQREREMTMQLRRHHHQLLLHKEKALKKPIVDSVPETTNAQSTGSVGQHSGQSSSLGLAPAPIHHHEVDENDKSLMPEAVRRCLEQLGGSDVAFVLEKQLSATDVNKSQSRLSLPLSKIMNRNFLTHQEKAQLNLRNPVTNGLEPIPVTLLQPNLIPITINFKKWDMKKDSGSVSSSYVFATAWNYVKNANNLKQGQFIRLWSFRCEGRLSFALVAVHRKY